MRRFILALTGILVVAFMAGCDTEGSNSNSNSNEDNGGGGGSAGNIWSYYYYADPDPAFNRVVVMDPASMTEVASVWVPGPSPHSADRAGFTDRMYIRTTGQKAFDVINARTMSYDKTVALPHKPRAAGAYNKYRNLQLISGKDQPMVSIIDVATDSVLGTVGPTVKAGQTISGNCGGNATGHSTWLDADHFTLLDRYNDVIVVYKVVQNGGGYNFVETDRLPMLTGVHTIDVDVLDKSLTKRVFYAEVEGSRSKNVAPHLMELSYDGNGHLIPGRVTLFPGVTSSDMTHHYSISPDGKYIWQPMCLSKQLFVIDRSTMQIVKTYPIGLGGGHVNFSPQLNLAIVTNHFDQDVTIINMGTEEVWNVHITDAHEEVNLFIQSHLNWVSPDGRFFYIFATHEGNFIEIDLTNKTVSRTYYTGGTPEQSTS